MPKYAKLPDASDDFGHEETDRILGRMEKKISKEYKQAEKELTEKLEKYLERFEAKDKVKRQQLADGVITQDEYNRWRIGQVATGERWKAMRDTIADEITKANEIAKSTINSHAEEVYSLNHNYAVFQAEKDAMIDTSYTLYNRRATEELFKNKQSLLPAPKKGSKAWQVAHNKDLRWNQQKINSSLIQGLLQGDSIPQIAKRLRDVVGMNKVSAVRNARTMTTGVENRARDDAVNDLRKKGIELDSVWIATLDNRTRHSHRLLHGEIKDLKTGKYSNGCRYPADPQGKPEEVYNCRCSQRSNVRGFPIDIPRWSPKMEGMTFEEWLGEHEDKTNAKNLNAFGHEYGKTFKVNGINVKLDKIDDHSFSLGIEGRGMHREADVYSVDGVRIFYPSDLDKSLQTLKPEELISEVTKISGNLREIMQDEIEVVDYRNTQDSYWAKRYKMKNFRSYAIGGKKITFFAYTNHDIDYVGETVRHEAGHFIDRKNSAGGVNSYEYFSDGKEWKAAQRKDEKRLLSMGRSKEESRWVSDYARSSRAIHEDFADSCKEYSVRGDAFEKEYPNRFAILKRLIGD